MKCEISTVDTHSGRAALLARRLVEAGTRFVQVNWPSVANGDPNTTAWDTHATNFGPLKEPSLSEVRQRGFLTVGRLGSTRYVG